MKEPTDKGSSPWKWIGAGLAIAVAVVWLGSGILIANQFGSTTGTFGAMSDTAEPATFMDKLGSAKAGTFGDSFGAINALFSGMAFAGVIVAILMQREELRLQRQELTRSTKAQEAQERALVIAAQLNANALLLQHSGILADQIFAEGYIDFDENDEKRHRRNEIRRLLEELPNPTATEQPAPDADNYIVQQ